jgi:hypothetical protein
MLHVVLFARTRTYSRGDTGPSNYGQPLELHATDPELFGQYLSQLKENVRLDGKSSAKDQLVDIGCVPAQARKLLTLLQVFRVDSCNNCVRKKKLTHYCNRLVIDGSQNEHRLGTDWSQTGHTWSQPGHRLVTD